MNRLATLAIALSLTGCANHAVMQTVDLSAAYKCMTQVTGLPVPAVAPQIVYADDWTYSTASICCNVQGAIVSGNVTSMLSIKPITGERKITMYASAGFKHLVHELAADAWVQNGGSVWDLKAREVVGYKAEFAAQDCNH